MHTCTSKKASLMHEKWSDTVTLKKSLLNSTDKSPTSRPVCRRTRLTPRSDAEAARSHFLFCVFPSRLCMAVRCRSNSLQNEQVMCAPYERERPGIFFRDEDSGGKVGEPEPDCSRGFRKSPSLEIYGLQREQRVHFSNLEYYRRLEELKNTHLRNMAELERMYISPGGREEDGGWLERESDKGPIRVASRKLQRINSQEELDFHETSSGSDHSELSGDDNMKDMVHNGPRRTLIRVVKEQRDTLLSPDDLMIQKHFRFQRRLPCQTGSKPRSKSKVTVPRPFQMTLREEERKRHQVRTRSEIELENTLLRQELEELKECQKNFRASPAPAHVHLPLYDIIRRRSRDKWRPGSARSLPPFHFLERDRRKKEAQMLAELAIVSPQEERHSFKARPVPGSVYAARHGESQQSPADCTLTPLVPDVRGGSNPSRPQSSKAVKKQIELSIELVKESEWSYIDPPGAKEDIKGRTPCHGLTSSM
ncbi:protein FAM161A-like isoform X2 [Dunckerocampus dactyliophorus]|uniref:protein FAM161A-like isoform X2 n=1 Tax=Dunckerocampus dactyliophorus TaxID=161453 RepID=UPI002405441F|nr:protein FAM161A-like isoform X2 [Dunckerocampus dactyliophorus]